MPDKYGGKVGPNYEKWGEQPGYTYNPATDRYERNASAGGAKKPGEKFNPAGLIKLGKHAVDAYEAAQAGSAASSTLPAGYAVASDGTLINTSTGAYEVGTAANGGALMSDGTTVGSGASGESSFGNPSAAGWIAAATEVPAMYGATQNDMWDTRRKAQEFNKHAGLAVGDVFLAGLPSLVYNLGMKTKLGRKIDNGLLALDRKMGWFGPSAGMDAVFEGLGMGKSTKAYQMQRWGDLGTFKQPKEGEDVDPYLERNQLSYLANHPENDTGIWETGPHKGQKWSWDIVKEDLKNDGSQGNLFLGNLETFGNDWHNIDVSKRNEIVKRLAQEGLYTPDKGDVVINNQDRARQILDEILGTNNGGAAPLDEPIV